MAVFETQRLSIRKITADDAKNLAKVLADPNVMQYSTVGVHSQAQILAYIDNCQVQYKLNTFGHWAIYSLTDNEFIGVCGLNKHLVDGNDTIHINYRLVVAQQGKGYALEASHGVLHFAKTVLELHCVYALIEPENKASEKVVKRADFSFIKSSLFRGFKVDVYKASL